MKNLIQLPAEFDYNLLMYILEDLNFSLIKPDSGFDIKKYLNAIITELESWGFEVSITSKRNNIKGRDWYDLVYQGRDPL